MSILAHTQQKLIETTTLIAKEERALVDRPDQKRSILASISSLEKVRNQLEEEFAYAASRLGYDICKYRILSDEGSYRLPSVANAVLNFQEFVSTIYDALKSGPKERRRLGAESVQESSFELAYSFAGSLGFALTIPNDRLLMEDMWTSLDESINAVCEMAVAKDTSEIARYARKYGNASIRAMRKWAEWHVRSGLSAEIAWQRNQKRRAELLIQQPELLHLQQTIDETSDEQITSLEVVGLLTKVDIPHKRFTLEVENATEPIDGKFSDAIDESHEARVPHRYKATLTKTTKTRFAFDTDEESYFLETIRAIDKTS